MSESNFSYYQFNKDLGYQIYLRFEDLDFETQLGDVLGTMGFDKVDRDKVKGINFDPRTTKVLKMVKANAAVARQITKTDFVNDKFGAESLSQMGSYSIYRYKNVGMMVFSEHTGLWELGLKETSNLQALKVIFTRFLSYALAPLGVVGFWGVPVDEGFVVMSPKAANFESLFVDLNKNIFITFDGIKKIDYEFQILRLDATLRNEARPMSREALIGFLSMNTSYLSYSGLTQKIKDSLYAISKLANAFIYPEENFKPREAPENSKAA